MIRIDILTVLPELLTSPLSHSVIKRGRERNLVDIRVFNLRDWATDSYKSVDDYPYGGGAGMVIKPEPVFRAFEELGKEVTYDEIIYTTPDGKSYTQSDANRLSTSANLLILCGHYKGIDQRIRDQLVTLEYSIGDYVLSGGELAAAVITDSIVRLVPGVLGDETSALSDSFQDGLLAPPVYTRPASFRGLKVPAVLLSGDQARIDQWRMQEAMKKTEKLRPDLWKKLHGD